MSAENGPEPKKPRVNVAFTDDAPTIHAPKWLFEDPDRYVDGMTFTLHRRVGNHWELVLTASPAVVEHAER